MRTILCYGDSITWGRNAADGSRFPFDVRWPGVLQAKLGPPEVLLVSPPHFGTFSPFMELFFRGAGETCRGLAPAYATVAEACGARFLDGLSESSCRSTQPSLRPTVRSQDAAACAAR